MDFTLGGLMDTIRMVQRNPGIGKDKDTINAARRGIYAFKKTPESKQCFHCGRTKYLDMHHIFPSQLFPEYAEDPDNFVALCRKPQCHLVIGHRGEYAGTFCPNIKDKTTPNIYITIELPKELTT